MGHTIDTLIEALKEQVALPKADLEKNLRALLGEWVNKMDLVSKDELQRQQTSLEQANQRLSSLQKQLQHLEAELAARKA